RRCRGRVAGVRDGRGSRRRRWSCCVLLAEDLAAFVGGEAAPDAVVLPGFECPFEAGVLGGAHAADAFGVGAGAALFGEPLFGVCLGAAGDVEDLPGRQGRREVVAGVGAIERGGHAASSSWSTVTVGWSRSPAWMRAVYSAAMRS